MRTILPALFGLPLVVAALDVTRLPAPAPEPIDFNRDIQPIFAASCLRCHGGEKPKSRFQLDNSVLALRGGDNGVAIVPGDSAGSPLIHYVAHLVPDMEMPPPDKGAPLTSEQIGLLRAWIDQGARWDTTNQPAKFAFTFTTSLRQVQVQGDERKFREVEGIDDGWGGGIEEFSLQQQLAPDKKFSAEGRLLFDDHDAAVKLTFEQTDVGFIRGGVEQWRRYYDDTGGHDPSVTPSSVNLGRDLYLEHQRAWIDFGLTLPDWPAIVIGYEYQSRNGDEATLQWGPIGGKNIYPSPKEIDEHTHILKFDLTHEWEGWRIEDSARVEFYNLNTRRDNVVATAAGSPVLTERGGEHVSYVQGANSLRLEKQIKPWWLASGGYLFSKFSGDSTIHQVTLDANNMTTFGRYWRTDNIILRRDAHVISFANLFTPVDGLSLSANAQGEWSHQEGFGEAHLDLGDPNIPDLFFLFPASLRSDLDRMKTSENLGLRFSKIPWTTLFAEVRLEQETVSQFERETGAGPEAFLRDTDATNHRSDWRAGFNTSPWRWFALSGHYRELVSASDYDHNRDISVSGVGYSAFITSRKIRNQEVELKLVLRPATWLKTTFTYQRTASEYFANTDSISNQFLGVIAPGGKIFAGEYDADVFGFSLTFTPVRRLYLNASLTYSDSRTRTAQNGHPPGVPYRGDIYTLLASANYAVNARTTLQSTYSFSRADFFQNNLTAGVPLGVSYIRHGMTAGIAHQFNDRITGSLRYGFHLYDERGPSDYQAHSLFAAMSYQWR